MPSQNNEAGNAQLQTQPTQTGQGPGAVQVRDLFEKASKAIRAEQQNYWLNHAFLLGEQWLYFNRTTNQLDRLTRDPDRVQITVNQIWPSSRTLISKVVSRPLVYDVAPTAADDATVRAAMTSESIVNALIREHDWEELREELAWAVWKGGTAAVSVEWDPTAGREIGLSSDGVPFNEGDTYECALAIVDFVVEPGVKNAEKARWWIKFAALPPEEVQALYGLPEKPKADATAAMTPYQRRMLADHSGFGEGELVDLTRVLTYYERPNGLSQQGAMKIMVGEEIVSEGPWPFPFKDKLNLSIVKETRGTNRWTGETVMKAARSVQMGINQSWSSIIEHMKLAGNARLFVPQSVVEMIQDLTDLPGEIVPYPDGETPPQWTAPPTMPDWWIQQPEKLSMEMDRILGVHDVSRGEAPVNVESGIGLSILIEQDSTPIGRITKEIASCLSKVGRQVLSIYQENVVETRRSVIKTPGQPNETTNWTGGNLLGQIDAVVPVDAVMPRNRAQQLEFAKMAMQMGLIASLEEFVTLAELPDQRNMLERLSPDVAKARSENAMMRLGSPEAPAVFDDHAAHIREHLTFMKGPVWRILTPEQQNIFIMHNLAHQNLDAELLGRQVAKMQVSPVLAASVDANGAKPIDPALLQPQAPAGGPPEPGAEGGPGGSGYKKTPSATDKGKQVGNAIASGRAAKNDFASDPETVTGGIP